MNILDRLKDKQTVGFIANSLAISVLTFQVRIIANNFGEFTQKGVTGFVIVLGILFLSLCLILVPTRFLRRNAVQTKSIIIGKLVALSFTIAILLLAVSEQARLTNPADIIYFFLFIGNVFYTPWSFYMLGWRQTDQVPRLESIKNISPEDIKLPPESWR